MTLGLCPPSTVTLASSHPPVKSSLGRFDLAEPHVISWPDECRIHHKSIPVGIWHDLGMIVPVPANGLVRLVHHLRNSRHNGIHLQTPPVQALLVCSFGLKDHVALIMLLVFIPARCWTSSIVFWVIALIYLIYASISGIALIPEINRPGQDCNYIGTCQRRWGCRDRWSSRSPRTCTTC
jgi:hypothetical protein